MRLEWWQGDAGADYSTVVVWSDTAGSVTVSTPTTSQVVEIDTGVRFGVSKVVVSGISDLTPVEVVHSAIASPQSGLLRVLPGADETWYFAFASCAQHANPNYWVYDLLRTYDIRMMWMQDDMPYADGSSQNNTRWHPDVAPGGYLNYDVDGAAAWWDTHPQFLATFGIRDLMQAVPTYITFGDHAVGDDWDHKGDHAGGSTLFDPSLTTQEQVDAAWAYGMEAWDAWAYGNPAPTTDSEAEAYKPSEANADVSNYPVRYFRKTVGNVEFFTVDTMSHKCPVSKADPGTLISASAAAKTMLGLPQFNWVKARVPASLSDFKMLMSGQCFWNRAAAVQADFVEYQTERNHIAAYLGANATGLMVVSGDTHAPIVAQGEFLSVCSGTAGQEPIGNGTEYWTDGNAVNTWRPNGPGSVGDDAKRNTVGLMKVAPTYMQPMIVSIEGEVLYRGGKLRAGSNTPANEQRTGIT